jgi:hypothetical protein
VIVSPLLFLCSLLETAIYERRDEGRVLSQRNTTIWDIIRVGDAIHSSWFMVMVKVNGDGAGS